MPDFIELLFRKRNRVQKLAPRQTDIDLFVRRTQLFDWWWSFMINKEVSFRLFEISYTSSTLIDSYFKQPLNKRFQERAQAAFCSCWANVGE